MNTTSEPRAGRASVRRGVGCVAWGVVVAALAAAGHSRGDEVEDNFVKMIEQQRAQQEASLKNTPQLDKQRFEEVFQLRLEDNALVLRTTAATDGGRSAKVQIAGRPGWGTLVVMGQDARKGRAPELYVPQYFQLSLQDYGNPRAMTQYDVNARPEYFHLTRQINTATTYKSIAFSQTKKSARFGQQAMAQLSVNEGDNRGGQGVSVQVSEPDFLTLRRKHPKELNQYLRPLFEEFGQDAGLLIDPAVLLQVFADVWQPDPAVGLEVTRRLPALDSPDFRTRDRASAEIKGLGREAAVVALRLDRSRLSAEQTTRLDVLLSNYLKLSSREVNALRGDVAFLIDCLAGDDPLIRLYALGRLKAVTGQPVEFDPAAAPEARAAAVRAIRAKFSPTPTTQPIR